MYTFEAMGTSMNLTTVLRRATDLFEPAIRSRQRVLQLLHAATSIPQKWFPSDTSSAP